MVTEFTDNEKIKICPPEDGNNSQNSLECAIVTKTDLDNENR